VTILAIAAGGALGSVSRYLIAVRLYNWLGIALPWGTLTVNIIGSFLLGVVIALVEEHGVFGPEPRSFLTVGFLGGMTTFSTFVYDGWDYTRHDDLALAVVYGALTLAGGMASFVAGNAALRAA
jgi:CrcB protein